MVKVAPSLLAANFAVLKEELDAIKAGGASWVHYDVMDGHFVPNISFGYSILDNVSKVTDLYLDVHLMVSDPRTYYPEFVKAGANLIVFHVEAMNDDSDTESLINEIKATGVDVGISIKPNTPVSTIETFLSKIDVILVMSVEPGFGGQSFNDGAIEKIQQLDAIRKENNYSYEIEVDGGINDTTGMLCTKAGADVLVAGSYVFNSDNYQEKIKSLCK